MPKTVEARKGEESVSRSRSSSRSSEEPQEQEQAEEESRESDKSAILERLKAQGAVRVFPGMGGGGPGLGAGQTDAAGTSASEETHSLEQEAEEAPVQSPVPAAETPAEVPSEAPPAAAEVEETPAQASVPAAEASADAQGGGGIDQAFHDRVQKTTDAANNPKWYDLPQHIQNSRYGKWDLSRSRERSGNRDRDQNLEEDVRTNQVERRLMPGTFDVTQKAKNAVNDVVQNPGQTAVGMIPLVGKGLKQKMAEKYDVKERDLLRGIAATSGNETIKESASSRAKAVGTKITADRVKAGIGTVTGLVGDFVPGGSVATGAVSAATGLIGDLATSDSRKQVNQSRAREEARKAMGKKEFGGYEGVDEFIELEKQRHALVAAGKSKAGPGAGAPTVDSDEQMKRLVAHTRGDTPHYKLYKERAKQVEKERAEAAKPKTEAGGLMSRVKRFFNS